MKKIILIILAFSLALQGCSQVKTVSGIDPEAFKSDSTALYILTNASGMEACITNFGARIVSLCVPDKDGKFRDVEIGFNDLRSYVENPSAYGAVIGPYANRIAKGRFELDGETYELAINNGPNCLHGGPRTWQYSCYEVLKSDSQSIAMKLSKPAGQFNFPGNVDFTVTYTLTDDNKLDVKYEAETDAPTVLNVTNHSFFNLSGEPQQPALDYILYVDADRFTPTDETQIPTGEMLSVEGTPFDFRTPKAVGQDIDADDAQLKVAKGYDHSLVLNHPGDDAIVAASLYCPASGIKMEVYTDQPGIQVYSANNVNASIKCKDGLAPLKQAAVCLETQHFPDSPNHPEFPSTVLRPGEKFSSHTAIAFSVVK